MKYNTISRKDMSGLCAEPSDDDGLVPHARSKPMLGVRPSRSRSSAGLDRKVLQLCHQVAETLEEVLAECGDAVLQDLRVLDVEPAPDASRLLVTVAVDGWQTQDVEPSRVYDHLARAAGHLRSEVSGAITRKRTPVLVYRLVASDM
jgi:ribosome-binding factor A